MAVKKVKSSKKGRYTCLLRCYAPNIKILGQKPYDRLCFWKKQTFGVSEVDWDDWKQKFPDIGFWTLDVLARIFDTFLSPEINGIAFACGITQAEVKKRADWLIENTDLIKEFTKTLYWDVLPNDIQELRKTEAFVSIKDRGKEILNP